MTKTFRDYLERNRGRGRRSTALAPIIALCAVFVAAGPGLSFSDAANWVMIGWYVILGSLVSLFGGAYIYFMLKRPEMLRSERFVLEKLAIEKSTFGDNLQGHVDMSKPHKQIDAQRAGQESSKGG